MTNMRNQNAASCGGLFGWLASLIGSNTPAYVGDGQPSSCGGGGGGLFGGAPTYQVAPPEPVPDPGGGEETSTDPNAGNGDEDGATQVPVAIIIRREVRPEDVAG